jgi:hypothetical protein
LSPTRKGTATKRRKKSPAPLADSSAISDAAARSGPERLRRALLGLITALVVAGPLVAGDDAGLLLPWTAPAGLFLTLFWLVALAGWSVWHAWDRRAYWQLGAVELGLLAFVGLVVVSAGVAAGYQRPAWLLAWQWGALFAAFWLVRQLAPTLEDNQLLLAAVVATGVSLAAQAVYQQAAGRAGVPADLEKVREAWSRLYVTPLPEDPRLLIRLDALRDGRAAATFGRPEAFAAYLALVLPAALGYAVLRWRAERGTWRSALTVGAAVLLAVALWLTQSWGSLLACLAVGAAVAGVWYGRAEPPERYGRGLVLLVAVVGLALALWRGWPAVREQGASWAPTWSLIQDRPWFGVGPGNFDRHFPRYLSSAAQEYVTLPANFALEVGATAGLLALLALLAAWAGFFRRTLAFVTAPRRASTDDGQRTTDDGPDVRWEFYLGGVAGLLLGFLLRVTYLPADEIFPEAWLTCGRSLVWFAAFALLSGVAWTRASFVLATAAGVAAALLHYVTAPGSSLPTAAQPLWVVAALSLNALAPPAAGWQVRNGLTAALPVPLTAALALVFGTLVLTPAVQAAREVGKARRHYGDYLSWQDQLRRERVWPYVLSWFAWSPGAAFPADLPASALVTGRLANQREGRALLETQVKWQRLVIDPLAAAARRDPSNAAHHAELAYWHGKQWEFQPQFHDPEPAVAAARRARQLDPRGADGYAADYRLRARFAQQTRDWQQARTEFRRAADMLRQLIERDPTNIRLHYRLAEIYFMAGNTASGQKAAAEAQRLEASGQKAAAEAQRLDQQARHPERKLTDPQREQIRAWLRRPSPG